MKLIQGFFDVENPFHELRDLIGNIQDNLDPCGRNA